MTRDERDEDVQAIEAVIARQFASLSWTHDISADWSGFAADFLPDAQLYPAARPVRRQTVEAFIERMQGLQGTKLNSFREAVLGTDVQVFGNVAVALAVCEMTENDADVHRGVEMLLLVKDEGTWRIASQAWDTENLSKPLPPRLLDLTGERPSGE